jgi:sugar/nucleoside kinase (ribokinase family)
MTLVTLNGGSDLAAAAHDASTITSLSLDDLPPPDTRRWVMRRKAEVVAGVRSGLLTFAEACARYGLSEEELASWQRLIDRHGVKALRVTRLQDYRRKIGAD